MVLPDLGGWSYTGFMAKALDGVDIAWIVGLIVSGGVYWFLTRSLDVESEKQAEAIQPARAGGGGVRAQVLQRVGALAGADLDLPEPVGDQVRVRLTASGVCHSDLHAFNGDWTVPLPLVLGHEGAGVVEAVGPDVRDVVVGTHVVLSWFAPCRRCRACALGPAVAVHAARARSSTRRRSTACTATSASARSPRPRSCRSPRRSPSTRACRRRSRP